MLAIQAIHVTCRHDSAEHYLWFCQSLITTLKHHLPSGVSSKVAGDAATFAMLNITGICVQQRLLQFLLFRWKTSGVYCSKRH